MTRQEDERKQALDDAAAGRRHFSQKLHISRSFVGRITFRAYKQNNIEMSMMGTIPKILFFFI